MAKRGESRPYRMRYEWPATDGAPAIAGTTVHHSLAAATDAAQQQAARVGPTGARCTVTVTHRDRPKDVLLRLEAGQITEGGRVRIVDPMLDTCCDGAEGTVLGSGRHDVRKPDGAVWWVVQVDGHDGPQTFDASQLQPLA